MPDSHQPTIETFHIPALDCPDELALINKGLGRLDGVGQVAPNYINRTLRVEIDGERLSAHEVETAISDLGFDVRTVTTDGALPTVDQPVNQINRTTLVGGLLLAVAVVARIVVTSTAPWIAALVVASTLVSSYHVVRAAWRAVRLRALDMNVLMTLAATGALATGEYFEAATAMFLFSLSLWLESLSMGRARRAIESLVSLTPKVAHRLVSASNADAGDNQTETVDAAMLRVGDVVVVKPGEHIPVDGTVRAGASAVSQAPITGESMPVEKNPGDGCFAGTLNGEGALQIETTRAAAESTLAHIARLVEQAQATRSPTERFVDQFARRYTPAVIVLAVLMAVVPWIMGAESVGVWFYRSLVLLVIACPCALVISTPVTIVCGLHQAARRGMLIKGGEHLENAGRVDAVALDKTGTLTTGSARVTDVQSASGHAVRDVLRIAASLEQQSEHPLAQSIVAAAEQENISLPNVSNFLALRGFGLQGEVDGRMCLVGTRRLLEEQGVATDCFEDRAETAAYVAVDSKLAGVIWLSDELRDGAGEALADLRRLGVRRLALLTGDRKAVAERLVERLPSELSIDIHADLLPNDKLKQVRRLTEHYPALAVVGDGVNDAPALAAARLGIALGAGASDTALETADVVVMTPTLSRLPELLRLGKKCRRLLGQNIVFAIAVKVAVLALAAVGWATMWMAVAADVGASLIVIANGMRIIGARNHEK